MNFNSIVSLDVKINYIILDSTEASIDKITHIAASHEQASHRSFVSFINFFIDYDLVPAACERIPRLESHLTKFCSMALSGDDCCSRTAIVHKTYPKLAYVRFRSVFI